MNILIIRNGAVGDKFAKTLTSIKQPGLAVLDYPCANGTGGEYAYALRNMQWATSAAPNGIVYPLSNFGSAAVSWSPLRIGIAAKMAQRDQAVFFLVVPPIQSEEDETVIRQIEDRIMANTSNLFILHKCDADELAEPLARMITVLVNSGMFGRYEVVKVPNSRDLTVKPLRRKDSLR